jgi:hypothetical protein
MLRDYWFQHSVAVRCVPLKLMLGGIRNVEICIISHLQTRSNQVWNVHDILLWLMLPRDYSFFQTFKHLFLTLSKVMITSAFLKWVSIVKSVNCVLTIDTYSCYVCLSLVYFFWKRSSQEMSQSMQCLVHTQACATRKVANSLFNAWFVHNYISL